MPADHLHAARQMYERQVSSVTLRTRTEVHALFDGFDLVEPGVVWIPEWRPEPSQQLADLESAAPRAGYGGVAIKP